MTSHNDQLFDPELLRRVDFTKYAKKFEPAVTPTQPGAGLIVRPLSTGDYDRGFLQLLNQLTDVGNVTREQFLQRFTSMKACPNTYHVVVVEDTNTGQVVGTSTLVVEQKFLHDMAKRGFLEDVVVSDNCRGKQLGKLIVATVIALAEYFGCYKITLDCKDELMPFYKALGFTSEAVKNSMTIRFISQSSVV